MTPEDSSILIRQLINLAVGLALAFGVMWLGHHRLRAAVPAIRKQRPRDGEERSHVYVGIALRKPS